MKNCPRAVLALAWMILAGPVVLSSPLGTYYLVSEIPIGGTGSGSCMAIDPSARRLYLAVTTKIVIIDLETEKVAGAIAGTPGVRAFAIASNLGRGFSRNGRESKMGVIDLKSLKTVAETPTGLAPDAIVYEPARQEVYVFNGRAKSASVFDAASATLLATVPLPGQPQSAAADPNAQRVYCDMMPQNEIVAIDTQQHDMLHAWSIAPGKVAAAMSIDTAHHRLFIGCRNKRMIMMDGADGRIAATAPIGEGVGDEAFDPATGLVFSCCADGTTTIAHEDTPEKLIVFQTLSTRKGAHTMALDPATHKIYLAAVDYEAQPDPEPGQPVKRARKIPGTLKILVYGMAPSAGQK
jgi:DNA-binding beta-propeller fold protein YncE